jgi:hypothetical protein
LNKHVYTLNGLTVVDVARQTKAEAWKKGLPCIWYKYSTPMTWNACNLSGVMNPGNIPINYTPADVTINTSTIDRSALLLTMPETSPSLNFTWTTKASEITHQGMAGSWIIL